jgi:hypothetical protein
MKKSDIRAESIRFRLQAARNRLAKCASDAETAADASDRKGAANDHHFKTGQGKVPGT